MTCGKWVGGLSPVPSGQVSTAQKLPSQLGLISNLVVAATGKPGAHIPTVLWEAWLDIRWCAPKVQCRNAHRGPCKKCCCFRRNRTAPRTALHFSPDSPKPEMSESGMRFKVLFQPTEWTCLWHLKCYVIPPFIRAIDATATQKQISLDSQLLLKMYPFTSVLIETSLLLRPVPSLQPSQACSCSPRLCISQHQITGKGSPCP